MYQANPLQTFPFLFTLLLLASACSVALGQNAAKEPPLVRIEAVGTLDTSQPESLPGIVTAKETVIIVPRVSGYLTKVTFQEGSMVKQGDLLFEIEDTVYKMNVKVAESVVRQIEAEIGLAKKDLERILTLYNDGVATEQELDQAQRTINLQEAKLDEAKATLGLAENDLSYTRIVSPLTGRIGAKQFSEGNYITPSSGSLAVIVQYDPITVIFTLSEKKFLRYFMDDGTGAKRANIEILRTDGEPYTGSFKIDFMDNRVDRQSGTIAVHLICENPNSQLLPGGYAKVRLAERYEEPVTATKVAAVMTDGIHHYVYVVASGNKIERRNIVVGEQVFDRYIIQSGLQPGELVVVGGLNKISAGMVVRTVSPGTETAKK